MEQLVSASQGARQIVQESLENLGQKVIIFIMFLFAFNIRYTGYSNSNENYIIYLPYILYMKQNLLRHIKFLSILSISKCIGIFFIRVRDEYQSL